MPWMRDKILHNFLAYPPYFAYSRIKHKSILVNKIQKLPWKGHEGDIMTAQPKQKTHAEVKAEKRAAALRDNLKKRKALIKDKTKEENNDNANT